MTAELLLIPGGIGLFLFGMATMTDALRALAGPSLRRWLGRATRSPASGAAAGALTTAAIQSSSATTVATIGLVGAGLMTFPQALGVIFGANVGTTITGWLVALLGFKLQIGLAAQPLVLFGVLLKLYGGERTRHAGAALAGFALLFVGIDMLEQSMAAFQGAITPQSFPPDTAPGRLQLVALGAAITVITQSSSAGVATALAAIGAGAITFPQAAAIVIGMDVGTTAKALLAGAGGSTAMRRTGAAHVVYNLMTAAVAFAVLTPYARLADAVTAAPGVGDPQIALVAFHTLFNGLGVLLVLPFASPFAKLIAWLIPEHGPGLTRRLEERLLSAPELAARAARETALALRDALAADLAAALAPAGEAIPRRRLTAIDDATDAARAFAERIGPADGVVRAERIAALHALDHVDRLAARAADAPRIAALRRDRALRRLTRLMRAELEAGAADPARLDRLRHVLRDQRERQRSRAIRGLVDGAVTPEDALTRLDGVRWLHRTAYHFWRIAARLSDPAAAAPSAARRDAAETTGQPGIG